ncbi:MAG: energy transducer TonB [Proteobacteria bacterium]|nr:energy transducer TonB [Pseudomonadota bacterium]
MQYRFKRIIILGLMAMFLSALFSQCAWFRGEQAPSEIIKPTPVGGYDLLSTKIYYPENVRKKGIEGKINVRANISKTGEVLDARINKQLHPDLDRIAINAVKRTPFHPALRNGEPANVWISIPIIFALENWHKKSTPFTRFEMMVYPNSSYQSFEVKMRGDLKTELEFPLRFEVLLPFNAEKAWVKTAGGHVQPERVRDTNGEWLIFQVSDEKFDLSFNYQPLAAMEHQNFKYKFMMNHALPSWELAVIYGDQHVQFNQAPDRTDEDTEGRMRYSYDLESLNPYETRYLEVALQK